MKAPSTPAQLFAALAGIALVALGVVALVSGDMTFGAVDATDGDEIGIWLVSGWEAILYIAFGVVGLLTTARLATARSFCVAMGLTFATIGVLGFIDGSSVASVFAVDTADNITYVLIGALGLVLGLIPSSTQRPTDNQLHDSHRQDPPRAFPA